MIEDSPDAFIQRWRAHAAEVQLFARTEGSPLLECMAGGAIVQLLERTGPYQAGPGRRRVILNAMVERLEPSSEGASGLEVDGLGDLRGRGRVVDRDGALAVVDCGVPVVVAVLGDAGELPATGERVAFEVLPPVHGFVVPDPSSRRRLVPESPDDAM